MKKMYIWLLALFAMVQVQAQVASRYTFSQNVGSYTPITGGTVLATGSAMNSAGYSVTIPAFTFNGTSITDVRVNDDGYLALGVTSFSNSTAPISSSNAATGIIAGLAMNLVSSTVAGATPEIRWEQVGNEVIFQWDDFARSAQAASEKFDFQIRLDVVSGLISIVYSDFSTVTTSTSFTPQVGLRGVTNSDFNSRRLTTSVPDATPAWNDTAYATSNGNNVRFLNTCYPATGTTFVYTPAVCNTITSIPWTESFETMTAGQVATCWTNNLGGSSNTTNYFVTNNSAASYSNSYNDAHAGTNYISVYYPTTNAATTWTPAFNLTAGTSYDFIFYYVGDATSGWQGDVLVNSTTSATGATSLTPSFVVPATTTSGGTSYTKVTRTFVPSASGVYYFGIKSLATTSSPFYLGFDSFELKLTPTCFEPTNIQVSNTTLTGATIAWTAPTVAPASGYEYYYSTTNTAPTGAGTAETTTTVNLSGLTAETTYYVWVRSVCSVSDASLWTGPVSFYTGHCIPSSTTSATYINNFTTSNGITNISNLATGYTIGGYQNNYNTLTATSYEGNPINFNLEVVGGSLGVAIWVDWNNNLVFETSEKMFNTTSYSNGPFTGSIAIPTGTALGSYRMRVMVDYNNLNPTNPCMTTNTRTETEDYKFTVTTQPTDAVDWANIQSIVSGITPATVTEIQKCQIATVYTQVYEPGVTEDDVADAGLEVWIGKSTTNTDPSTWPANAWALATVNAGFDVGADTNNNDEFKAEFSNLNEGTYYFASRHRLNLGAYKYGATNGFWEATTSPNASLNVIAIPVITASSTPTAICQGSGASVNLNVSSANANYTYSWSDGLGTGTTVVATPTTTSSYTVTATDTVTGCSTTATVLVVVNPLPTDITITPTSPVSTCLNTIQTLSATGGTLGTVGSTTIGIGTTVTTQNGIEPTAFNNRYKHYWMQMVFTAAELNAAGIQAGKINGIKFNITTIGSATNVSDYRVNMGATTLSALTGFVTTGLTEVYTAATYTQQLGVNSIVFTTAYVWDGVSNIIVDVRNTGADASNNSSTYYTATTDNKTVSAVTSTNYVTSNGFVATNPAGTLSLKRLNTTFDWDSTQPTTITWAPVTNLYTDAAATTAYAGENLGTVYAKSATAGTTTYTATATSSVGCVKTQTVDVTIQPVTAVPTVTSPVKYCLNDTATALAATGTDLLWYDVATGGTGSATAPTPLTTTAGNTSYWVSQTLNGCESSRAEIVVTVMSATVLVAPTTADVCEGVITPLTASGGYLALSSKKIGAGTLTSTNSTPFKGYFGGQKTQAIYTAAELTSLGLIAGSEISSLGYVVTAGTPNLMNNFVVNAGWVAAGTQLNTTTSFNAGATTNVFTNATYTAPTGNGNIDYTLATPMVWDGTSDLLVETCFNNANGGGSLSNSLSIQYTSVASNLFIYRSQDNTPDVCSNTASVTATTARPNLRMTFTGPNYTWTPVTGLYTDAAATVPYVDGTSVAMVYAKPSTSTTYTVNSSNGMCSTTATSMINVTVVTPPTASAQSFCTAGNTVANLVATGTGTIVWYSTSTGGTALNATDALVSGTYYAAQNTGTCESYQRTAVPVTVVNISPITIAPTSPVTACSNVAQTLTATGGVEQNVLLYGDDFNAPTNSWITTNNSIGGTPADAAWTLRPSGYVYTNSTQLPVFKSNDNSQFYMSNSDDQGSGGTTATLLESPSFSLAGISAASLNFWHYYRDYDSADFARVQISTNGGVDWTNVQEYTTTQGSLPTTTGAQTTFANANLDLSAYIGQTDVKIRFKYDGAYAYYWAIDNVKILATKQAPIVWSPTTDLYTDAAATTAYTGTATTMVYAKSATIGSTTYTATATSSVGCSISQTVSVDVTANPTVVTVPPTATCAPMVVDLTAAAITTGSDAGLTFTYWTDMAATTAVATPTAVSAGTYYIKGTNTNGCYAIQSITITENDCSIGWANLQWPGSGTINTCGTYGVYAKVWKSGVTEAPGASTAITAWIGYSTTNTDPSTWTESDWHLATYNVQDGNNDEYMYTLSGLAAGNYYIASRFKYTDGAYYYGGFNAGGGGAWNGTTNVNATLTVNEVAAPTGSASQFFCNASTVANLVATGDTIQWYAAATGGTALASTDALVSGNHYFASQTVGGCESATRLDVIVTIGTPAPTGDAAQSYVEGSTLANVVVVGTGIVWYATATDASAGINPLPSSTVLVNNTTYYATQTVNSCTSATSLAVTITVTLGNDTFNTISVKYYPNPVTDVLNISALTTITNVKVINLIGQQVYFKTINATDAQIDLSALPSATYIVEVVAENAAKTFKVVKK